MLLRYWRLLAPFHRTFLWFLVLVGLLEGAQILEGYTISLVIKLFEHDVDFIVWAVVLLGMLVFDELFMRLDNAVDWHVVTKQTNQIYRFLKLGALSQFLNMSVSWHQKRNSGALVGKVAQGVDKVNEIVEHMSWEFIPTFVQTLFSFIPLLIISPQTAAVAFVAFVIFLWLSRRADQKRRPFREKRFDLYEQEWHRSIEIVQSHETNVMFGQKDRLYAEQERLHRDIISYDNKEAEILVYTYNRWRIRVLRFARRAILVLWVWQLYNGTMDIAMLVFASVLMEKLFHSFWRIARLFDRVSEASEGATRLANLLEEQPDMPDTEQPSFVQPQSLDMRLLDVCFAYSENYCAKDGTLHDLTLDIPAGSVVALVGPSGAGKTTIRKIITRLIPIQKGSITLGGVDINEWPLDTLLSQFSYVPQGDDVFIFAGTIRENIAFPRPAASDEEIVCAAMLSGIHEFIASMPDGYDTVVGERGKRLSGGQKQRIALARAIIANRPILILDEATSAVDAITETEIQRQMRTILHGKTAIIIAHRLSTVWDIADKIVVLDQGRKIEEGTHEELVRVGGLYAKMVALQTAEVH